MKNIFKFLLLFILITIFHQSLKAETYYLDFKYIIDTSLAGKKANQALKSELDRGIKKLKSKEQQLQDEEKKIIQQKKNSFPRRI